jgi:DNA mismatch endonuclease (patch repair protein)
MSRSHPVPKASSPAVRKTMQANKSERTGPELVAARAFRQARLSGWRRNVKDLPGSPDFVWAARNIVLFVDGCFWHRCPMHAKKLPKSNKEWWRRKFARNRRRDKKNGEDLLRLGWQVIRVWECTVKHNPQKMIDAVRGEMAVLHPVIYPGVERVKPTNYKRGRRLRRKSAIK